MVFRRISDNNMFPTLKPGRPILAIKTYMADRGVVIARDSTGREVAKRVKDIEALPEGGFIANLIDDNSATDSQPLRVHSNDIIGYVVWPRGLKKR